MGQRTESEGPRSPVGDDPEGSLPPAPPAVPNTPPPPAPIALPAKRPQRRIDVRNAIVALSLGAVGLLILAYAWLSESDSGYPEGLACTAHPAGSEAYGSCMLNAERGGAIAGALTLGLAVAALVMLRPRRGHHVDSGVRFGTLTAAALSVLLAIAGVNVWVRGATGDLYEDRLGPTGWHLAMVIAVGTGLAVGWAATRRVVEQQ